MKDIITYVVIGIFVIGGAFLSYAANRSIKNENKNNEQKK